MSSAADRFIEGMEHYLQVEWWTAIRLADCGELVYRHAVVICPCGRTQSQAYTAWREQNPEASR